jgi:signal transduction histidine kinase
MEICDLANCRSSYTLVISREMKISYYVLLSFLFIIVLFSLTTYNDYKLAKEIDANAAYLSQSTEIVRAGGKFQRNILTMVSGIRGYLLTGEQSFIESYNSANSENVSIIRELSGLLTDSSRIKLIREIGALNAQWTDEYTEPLKEAKSLSTISSDNLQAFNKMYREKMATGGGRSIQEQLQEKLRTFISLEYNQREKRKVELAASVNNIKTISYVLTIVSIVIAIAVIVFLLKMISGRIGQMTKLANAIASGNYDVNISDIGNDELSELGIALNHMAQKLSKNIRLLKHSNAELDQFAHIVSHDMKGPLRGISNVVTWIEEDHNSDLTPKVKEYIELIKGRIHRAENLIEGLLSYARITKELTPKEQVDINELIVEILENAPKKKNLEVSVDKLPTLFAERILLLQIFSNLVDNAIKYNDKPNPKVRIYCHDDGTKYEFFVQDNGIGIAENYHKKIYDIFQTLVDKDTFESTGVGLAIVKKILDSKQQQIKLTSVTGEGSTFSFTWPKE